MSIIPYVFWIEPNEFNQWHMIGHPPSTFLPPFNGDVAFATAIVEDPTKNLSKASAFRGTWNARRWKYDWEYCVGGFSPPKAACECGRDKFGFVAHMFYCPAHNPNTDGT